MKSHVCCFLICILLALFGKLHAQTACVPTVSITDVSCYGLQDGRIVVTPPVCSTGTNGCYSGTPVPVESCTSCSTSVQGSSGATISSGQKVCVQSGTTLSGTVTMNGGVLVICGTGNLSTLNLSGNAIVSILGTATITSINFNSSAAKVYNYGTVTFSNSLPVLGEFHNYGTATVNSDLNVNDGTGKVYNYKSLTVKGNLNNSEYFENRGTLSAGTNSSIHKVQLNSSSQTLNTCTINVTGELIIDGGSTYDQQGELTVSNRLTINGSSVLRIQGGKKITTLHFTGSNGSRVEVSGGTGCSLLRVTGQTSLSNNFILDGNLSFCDTNGIETNNGVTLRNGAGLNCTCNPTPGGTTTAVINWPDLGTTGTTIQDLGPGSYRMEMTCGSCTYSATYTVNEPAQLSASATYSNGKANLLVSGGTPGYSYQWLHDGVLVSAEAEPADLPEGAYTVNVTDSKGCTASSAVAVSEATCETEVPVVTIRDETCPGAKDGRIEVSVSDSFCPGSGGGNSPCFSGPAVPPVSTCTGCTAYEGSLIKAGEQYCISDSYSGAIRMEGGRLVICGTANASGVTLSGSAEIIVLGTFRGSNINYNSTSVRVANYGTMEIPGSEPVGGTFDNYGMLRVSGDWNINSGMLVTFNNYGTLIAGGSLNNSRNFNNYGMLEVSTHFQQNSGGMFYNYCTFIVHGNILINAEVHNEGKLLNHYGGSLSIVNGSGHLYMEGGLLEASDLQVNGPVSGIESSCSVVRYDNVVINAGGSISTFVERCLYGSTCSCTTAGGGTGGSGGGGSSPVYVWSGPGVDGKTGPVIDNLSPGVYTVTIECGTCRVEKSYTVESSGAISISPVGTPVSCDDAFDGSIRADVSGGSGSYNFVWSDGFKEIGTTQTIDHLLAGLYTVTVTDQRNAFCTAEKEFVLSLKGVPCPCEGGLSLSFDGHGPRCSDTDDGALTVTVRGGQSPYQYFWNTGATTRSISDLGAGWYGVLVVDNAGDSCRKRVFLPAGEASGVKIRSPKNTMCAGEILILTAEPSGGDYVWSPGNTAGPILVVTAPGTYSVTATSASGCTGSDVVTIAPAPAEGCRSCENFQVSVTPAPVSCHGLRDGRGDVSITGGSGDFSYAWSNGSSGKNLQNVGPGTYYVTVTDNTSGEICNGSVTISEPEPLEISITGNNILCGEESTELTATGSTGQYRWIGRSETTQSITVYEAGIYQVEVRKGSCSKLSDRFQVLQQPGEVSVINNRSQLCAGESIVLISSFPVNNQWSTGETTQSIRVNTPGTYTLHVQLGSCMAAEASVTITEAPESLCKAKPCEPQFMTPVDAGNPCAQMALDLAHHNAQQRYTRYLEEQKRSFRQQYVARCIQAQENFTLSYSEREHHYTLYYYDQSRNLVRTVPPEGVKIISDAAKLATIRSDRKHNRRTVETEHEYATTYTYNTLNQAIAQKLPDHGTQPGDTLSSRFWYDELGRIVLSQNARQNKYTPGRYTYTLYDKLNRIIEVGEVRGAVDLDTMVNEDNKSQLYISEFMEFADREVKYEVIRTYYDEQQFGSIGIVQENLRNRVASSTYEATDSDNDPGTYDHATHYSYDIHGHVKSLVQDNPSLAHLPGQRFKRVDYIYDLISQNVLELHYQKGQPDQFFHRNIYDADNRLKEVQTSSDYEHWDREVKQFYYDHGPLARLELGHEKVQGMDYAYTIRGWMKGVNSNTLRANRDMGKDGYNGGITPGNNRWIPQDQIGYSLGYYQGTDASGSRQDDYRAISNPPAGDHFLVNLEGSELEQANKNLFNGNVSYMITGIRDYMQNNEGPLAMTFRYDQLNRLTSSKAYQDNNAVNSNDWAGGGTATDKYTTSYSYDANGNILTLKRNAHTSTTTGGDGLDDLTYIYENKANGYGRNTNKLVAVQDGRNNAGNAALAGVDDIRPGQTFNPGNRGQDNYQYDEEGRLVADLSEGIISIEWNTADKVTKIIRADTSHAPDLEFAYDAQGRRIMKVVKQRNGSGLQPENTWTYTYYVQDVHGNPLAVYERKYDGPASPDTYQEQYRVVEQHIFGGGRLGYHQPSESRLVTRSFTANIGSNGRFTNVVEQGILVPPVGDVPLSVMRGNKRYELQNHLGNVLSVVSDRRTANGSVGNPIDGFNAELLTATDYYPFGMILPDRNHNSNSYRYGYNGMEKDDEVKGNGNGYTTDARHYDSRLARWTSIDPVRKDYESPFAAYANNPLIFVDPQGTDPVTPSSADEACQCSGGTNSSSDFDFGSGLNLAQLGSTAASVATGETVDLAKQAKAADQAARDAVKVKSVEGISEITQEAAKNSSTHEEFLENLSKASKRAADAEKEIAELGRQAARSRKVAAGMGVVGVGLNIVSIPLSIATAVDETQSLDERISSGLSAGAGTTELVGLGMQGMGVAAGGTVATVGSVAGVGLGVEYMTYRYVAPAVDKHTSYFDYAVKVGQDFKEASGSDIVGATVTGIVSLPMVQLPLRYLEDDWNFDKGK